MRPEGMGSAGTGTETGLRKRKPAQSVQLGKPSQLPLLNLCHMPDDPFSNIHRQPHAASYGEVGTQPPPHPLIPQTVRISLVHLFI